jgi:3-isopropylmalate/(R)-2-methylmalate dehydratase small subunit
MEPIDVIEGQVSFLDRDDVDTDQIIPKQFLKRIERTGFGEFLFHDWKQEEGWELQPHPILVAGRNFGCGSSREHAPWALEDYGFQAIIAPSFADIFFSNSTKVGLLPVTLSPEECKAIALAGSARIDLEAQQVSYGNGEVASFEIDPEIKRRLLDGLDDIALTMFETELIDAYEATMERHGPVTTAL